MEALHNVIIKLEAAIRGATRRTTGKEHNVTVALKPMTFTHDELAVIQRIARCEPVVWADDKETRD